jgi:uncharacterized protein (DUF111 family)
MMGGRVLYFDCSSGISGDMACNALRELAGEAVSGVFPLAGGHGFSSAHSHRSYADVIRIIKSYELTEGAKEKALSIFSVLAEAEADVHGTAVENVHFHEVGRDQAIENIVGAAACADALGASRIYCSAICDGVGSIECSHGVIPVPVPAVMAMRKACGLKFTSDSNVKTEMVTPSGLAILIGLGAVYHKSALEGNVTKKAVSYGTRETGRNGGLEVYLIQ